MEENKRGVLYVAFGDNFRKEVLFSIESLKKHNPGLHVTVFSDKALDSELVDESKVIVVNHLRPKIDYIDMSPYEETIFLDTDTIIDYNIEDMYDLLDNFDFAITHDLARKRKRYSAVMPEYAEIPYSFSEVNTGVFVFKNNEKVQSLFSDWKKYFYKYYSHCPWDQPSFRISLWKACQEGLKMYIFPVEYNIRSKQNREKNRRLHDEFGPDHLTPRIYHMHADMRINQGTYEVESVKQALEFCKKNHMEY
tara:strand:+ start:354 stop:1106 length:753 start_codon:yes stop_codon:yes gene_type:complete